MSERPDSPLHANEAPKRRGSIDQNWSEQKDRSMAIRANLCGSVEQDLDLIAHSPRFSILADPDLKKTRSESKKAAEGGPFDARLIEVTLRNAQLSYLIDEILLTFIEQRPLPFDEFKRRMQQITTTEKTQAILEQKYQTMLDAYENDRQIQDLPEHFEDVFQRHTDTPYHEKESFARNIATLKWLRTGIESGEITYDGEHWPLEKRATILKLPFADLVFMISANAFAYYGTADDLAERRKRKQSGDTKKTEQELRIEKLKGLFTPYGIAQADVGLTKLPHRSLISIGALYSTLEATLLSIRHELKHVLDQQLLSDDSLFYVISDPAFSFETALHVEDTLLVSECSALTLSRDFSHENFKKYYDQALDRLTQIQKSHPSHEAAITTFKADWQPILTFLAEEDEYLRKLDKETDLFLYHCIACSQTPKEVIKHLKHGHDYISSKGS